MRMLSMYVAAACISLAILITAAASVLPAEETVSHEIKSGGEVEANDGNHHEMVGLFAAVDMLFENDINHGRNSDGVITNNGFYIRAVEIGYAAPVFGAVRGALNLAVHEEEGEYFVELHEAYLDIPLHANISAKLGRYLIDAGTLNSIHRHEWDFTRAPLVHRVLFDEEGIFDHGGELSARMPLPFSMQLKAGFFNGRTWGHEEKEGPVKPGPLYTGRMINRFTIYGPLTMSLGGSYLRYMHDEDGRDIDHTAGADLVFQWGEGERKNFILAGEYWFRYEERPDAVSDNRKHGFYAYTQVAFLNHLMLGFRYDYYAELGVRLTPGGESLRRKSNGQSVWLTYQPGEALYFRLTGERLDHFEGNGDAYAVYLQADFHLGHHPHGD